MGHAARVWAYLGSLWGALSAAAVLFPGAAALLGVDITPENSKISTYYATLPSIVAAFSLLLLTSLRDELARISIARRVSISFFILALTLVFAFIFVRQTYVAIDQVEPPSVAPSGYVTEIRRSHGLVFIETADSDGNPISAVEKGDPRDLIALFLLTGCVASLAMAFGALGINEYTRDDQVVVDSYGNGV